MYIKCTKAEKHQILETVYETETSPLDVNSFYVAKKNKIKEDHRLINLGENQFNFRNGMGTCRASLFCH